MKANDVSDYLELFDSLRRSKKWGTDVSVLRFAALGLSFSEVTNPAAQLETAASELKRRAGWTGALNSPIRYTVAAMILRRGLRPGAVHDNIERTRAEFREQRLRRGGVQEVLAALILVLQNHGRRVPKATIARMHKIMKLWKKDHFWLTGTDDYPMAALHAHRDVAPETVSRDVETVYQALRANKYSRGNHLQLASHILSLRTGNVTGAARRFDQLAQALRNAGERTGSDRYDELALLSLTSGSPSSVIRALMTVCDTLMAAKPKPSKAVAFSLAAGILLSREVAKSSGLKASQDAAMLAGAQAILDAQAAAMAAIMAATTAATMSATTVATS